ncbi:hypothetical protein A2483_02655 [Candidatus Peregrinibacteria bacterium RIFOXYC2_FULL_33_13]|nr:MAG: hypothetical protein A2229_04105 [Candidatus Peregrinibacteria bacterium RIFOXYA2_FULL_33_7]OGJ53065.1 MAG: hypothetical protein A2483_02655 [Candidatus Peregrinibacteria bacterium RIFOXYC2_FULL_33_13]
MPRNTGFLIADHYPPPNYIPTTTHKLFKPHLLKSTFSPLLFFKTQGSFFSPLKKKNMKKEGEKKEKIEFHPLRELMFEKHLLITYRAVGIALSTILIFGGIGYYLDLKTGKKPLFLIILLVAAFPVMQILIIKSLKNLTKKYNEQHPRSKSTGGKNS